MQISKSCIQSQDRSGYLYLGILLFSSSSVGVNEFATYIDMCMCMCVCVCVYVCVCVCVGVCVRAWCLALMCSLLYYYGTISKHCYHSNLAVSELSKGQYNILSLQNDRMSSSPLKECYVNFQYE